MKAAHVQGRGYDLSGKRVWVAGHRGMVGSVVPRRLASENCTIRTATRTEVDLTRQAELEGFVRTEPDAIVLAAAKGGGILANDTFPTDFLCEILLIETAIFGAAHGTRSIACSSWVSLTPILARAPACRSSI